MFRVRLNIFWLFIAVSLIFCSCGKIINKEPGRYYDLRGRFSIKFPDGWEKQKAPFGAAVSMANPELTAGVMIVVQRLPDGVNLEQFVERTSSRAEGAGIHESDYGMATIDGVEAYWAISSVAGGSMVSFYMDGQKVTTLKYDMVKGKKAYTIICIVTSDDFSDYEDTFIEVAETFRFGNR